MIAEGCKGTLCVCLLCPFVETQTHTIHNNNEKKGRIKGMEHNAV